MRNWFVGILFVVGVCLYLIKGFSKWEDILLTIAGILAVCALDGRKSRRVPETLRLGCHVFHFHCVRLYVLFRQDIEVYAQDSEPGEGDSSLQASVSGACHLYGSVSDCSLCVQWVHPSK